MVAMGNGFVAAIWAVYVVRIMTCTLMIRCARIRVFVRHFNRMLINMIAMRVVQLTIVQVINMAIMLNLRMAAIRAVLMRVVLMNIAAHRCLLG